MKKLQTVLMQCFAVLAAGILLAGCPDNDGPIEELGEEVEDVTEELDNH